MTETEPSPTLTEGKPDENKVVESLEKGNKSYYFWSRNLQPEELGHNNPQLLSKEVVTEPPKTRPQITLTSYYWDEDKQFVKIYVPLEGIGSIPKENVKSQFDNESSDLLVENFKDQEYRLGLPNLFGRIITGASSHKILANKIVLSLKKEKEKKWGFLCAAVKP